jgi:hypothetical protein
LLCFSQDLFPPGFDIAEKMFRVPTRDIEPPQGIMESESKDPFIHEQAQDPDRKLGLAEKVKKAVDIAGAIALIALVINITEIICYNPLGLSALEEFRAWEKGQGTDIDGPGPRDFQEKS